MDNTLVCLERLEGVTDGRIQTFGWTMIGRHFTGKASYIWRKTLKYLSKFDFVLKDECWTISTWHSKKQNASCSSKSMRNVKRLSEWVWLSWLCFNRDERNFSWERVAVQIFRYIYIYLSSANALWPSGVFWLSLCLDVAPLTCLSLNLWHDTTSWVSHIVDILSCPPSSSVGVSHVCSPSVCLTLS